MRTVISDASSPGKQRRRVLIGALGRDGITAPTAWENGGCEPGVVSSPNCHTSCPDGAVERTPLVGFSRRALSTGRDWRAHRAQRKTKAVDAAPAWRGRHTAMVPPMAPGRSLHFRHLGRKHKCRKPNTHGETLMNQDEPRMADQIIAAEELVLILTDAAGKGLRPLVWAIPPSGKRVNGECINGDAGQREQDFMAWAQLLGVQWFAREHPKGGSVFNGTSERDTHGVVVILFADCLSQEARRAIKAESPSHPDRASIFYVPGYGWD